jgi:endoglucanase
VVGDPFEGRSLYVDPDNPASRQADAWRASRPSDAAAMDRIGENPLARWFGRSSGQVGRDVDRYVSAAEDAGALPVLVAYNIPSTRLQPLLERRGCVGRRLPRLDR